MAIVRFGGGVSELRGSIAGNTFSRSRAGGIVRNRITPINPSTTFQSAVRNNFAQAVSEFRNLSAPKIDEWNTFAQTLSFQNALGQDYTPSAEEVYLRSSLNLSRINIPPLGAAPIATPDPPVITSPGVADISAALGVLTLAQVAGFAATATSIIVVETSLPVQSSINNFSRLYKQLGFFVLAATIDFLSSMENRFLAGGSIPASTGQAVGIRLRAILPTNGFASPWAYYKGIVA